jgi:hypothetical protein
VTIPALNALKLLENHTIFSRLNQLKTVWQAKTLCQQQPEFSIAEVAWIIQKNSDDKAGLTEG